MKGNLISADLLNRFLNAVAMIRIEVKITFLLVLIACIFLCLYYRYVHVKKCSKISKKENKTSYVPGPKEWERQMTVLALEHHQTIRKRYNYVLEDQTKLAHKRLNFIRNTISEISSDIIGLIPAARWLFDNYQLLYREIKKENTMKSTYENLPTLKDKKYYGYPRIYIVAKKMVSISGGHLDEDSISVMLYSYLKHLSLNDEEIAALPSMLGFAVLEEIIDNADDIIDVIKIKSKADQFVKSKVALHHGELDVNSLLCNVDVDCKKNLSFHSHVLYLLKNMSFSKASILKYSEYHFANNVALHKPANIFSEEGILEAYLESSIHGLIDSLRGINEIDEQVFLEKYSYIESVLSKDPDGVYSGMDPVSKSMYRAEIITLSRKYKVNEEQIVKECLKLAVNGRNDLLNSHHVGTYLIGRGYDLLKNKIRGKKKETQLDKKSSKKMIDRVKEGLYFFALYGMFALFMCLIYFIISEIGNVKNIYVLIVFLLISSPILLGIAQKFTNHIFTRRTPVKKIPSLDYQEEIPDSARTFLVMPVIVDSVEQCKEYVERLHRHYLANKQCNLYFALLVDYADSNKKCLEKDKEIEEILIKKTEKLNSIYPSEHARFALFIRDREWNEAENCYMGWERKRGKLDEFNKLIYGCDKEETTYTTTIYDAKLIQTFKYVITLDADSNLIRDNAAKLIGIIDHPLNQPVFNQKTGKLEEGYAIIQPSVRNHIIDKNSSRFSEIFGCQNGISNYSFVISDIYQDVFNEGVYVGKGIYHVEAFHQILHDNIPENAVLSHDLLESCYVRTAFSSAVKILDVFPQTILSYVKREERWIRGDWQLLPWLFKGKPINGVSRWKMFDNLRRSLEPGVRVLLILMNLLFLPQIFYLWIVLIFIVDFLNLLHLFYGIIKEKIKKPRLTILHKSLWKEVKERTLRSILELVFTPYRAYTASNAILRTLYRVVVSRRNLLKWSASEKVEKSVTDTIKGYFLKMWTPILAGVAVLILLYYTKITGLGMIIYLALSLVWIFSFLIAYYIRKPRNKRKNIENTEYEELLLDTARRTWGFFKDFSKEDNGWLCPDNYQLIPQQKITDKTSPTNIGLQFLSILTARDFGFETLSEVVNNTKNLLQTVVDLPKWNGHLYNWYQISTLEVLNPAYISTVDSGNFFGHLITMKNGLLEQIEHPIIEKKQIEELAIQISKLEDIRELSTDYITLGDLLIVLQQTKRDIIEKSGTELKHQKTLKAIKQMEEEIIRFNLQECKIGSVYTLRNLVEQRNYVALTMLAEIKWIRNTVNSMLDKVDFSTLYNKQRNLFHIGFHVDSQTMDAGCYDLMASEALLTSFFAIARGDVPEKHWHKLGRLLTLIKGIPCFVSWSGTMFEYLMPKLVMREYGGTVFANTSKAAVLQQIRYAKQKNIPWGISESQYYRFDLASNYQYKAFGVPTIRLKPSFKDSLVVTPYATMLALSYAKKEAYENLKKLIDLGAYGEYGFFEAIDFDTNDPDELVDYSIVRSFMAHHQGMSIVAIDNFINQGIMRKRFHNESIIKATEALLEEKLESYFVLVARRGYTIKTRKEDYKDENLSNRYINNPAPILPVANYLCNNRYSVMITSDGDGFSNYMDRMIYRFRPDRYANTGNYIYIKNRTKNTFWSTSYHPTNVEADSYQAIFLPHQAEFKRTDGDIFTHTTVSLALTHDLEIRRVDLYNRGEDSVELQLTSYMEVVGDSYLAELSHPAFNKLFLESEFLEEESIFLSKRRNQKGNDKPYILHMVKVMGEMIGKMEYENDRLRFIGRNNGLENPDALVHGDELSNTAGFSNDPIMSMRVTVRIPAGESISVAYITGVCKSKTEAVEIGEEFSNPYRVNNVFDEFRRQSEMELKYLEITRTQHNAFQDLMGPIFYPVSHYRGPKENIRRNWKNQSFLWKFGVSGDIPIMLLKVKSIEEEGIVRDVLKAYEYLRVNRVKIDLIILNESKYGYMDDLNDFLNEMISTMKIYEENKERKSLFIINSYQLIPAEMDLLLTVARVVFSEETGIYFRSIKESLGETQEI